MKAADNHPPDMSGENNTKLDALEYRFRQTDNSAYFVVNLTEKIKDQIGMNILMEKIYQYYEF